MTGRQGYSARKAARIARLEEGAANMREQAEEQLGRVDQLAEQRPLGQPILVGHHSERAARRFQARIEVGMRRGVAMLERAEELERRAAAAENNEAISSDDPDAVERLQAKLSAIEARRDRWKAIAKALRSGEAAALQALALDAAERRDLEASHGYVSYGFRNASAEIRRIKLRITKLQARAERSPRPAETIGTVTIDEGENRVRIRFPGRPAAPVIQELKRRGFRWSRMTGVWQRYASEGAWGFARRIAVLAQSTP